VSQASKTPSLQKHVTLPGAIVLGLGSMVGAGVFVAMGLATTITGASVLLAITLAGLLAMANGMSSAQLAAAHPVAGGTYAYGYRYLSPAWGFTAGWMFLCAKSASAATSALAVSAYLLPSIGIEPTYPAKAATAIELVIILTGLVLTGLRRSNQVNAIIVGITVLSLITFVGWALFFAPGKQTTVLVDEPWLSDGVEGLLLATALCFVAYTGYGRIATMGEEVKHPAKTIPIAIVFTVLVTLGLYLAVTWSGLMGVGQNAFARATVSGAPLETLMRDGGAGRWSVIVAAGAIIAMVGVVLNLILGLSRVALAMGREGDLPSNFAKISDDGKTPTHAVLLVAGIIVLLILPGSIALAWTFSAVTVLIYYGLTNACALRLPQADRRFPKVIAWAGLIGCLGLACWIPWQIMAAGLGLLIVGHGLRWSYRKVSGG